tara:strand:+ start:5275 stop:5715 length:441 start_codon:yes stop_codon:yes gene_type:complete
MEINISSLIYNKALNILSRREHSKKELRLKLSKKFEDTEEIIGVIDRLESNNLLNDFRFAELYVSMRKRKGFGPNRISYELSNKGIKDSVSNQIIIDENGWEDAALKAFNKKYKAGVSEDFKIKLKQKNFLENRGFGFKEIESVFR